MRTAANCAYCKETVTAKGILSFLFPTQPERDEGFQEEVRRLGRRSLRVIGWIEIVMPVAGVLTYTVLMGDVFGGPFRLANSLAAMLLGIATLWVERTWWGGQHARFAALVTGFASCALAIVTQVYLASAGDIPRLMGGTSILLVLLVGLALLPLRPLDMLILGAASTAGYFFAIKLSITSGWLSVTQVNNEEIIGLIMIVPLCTVLAGLSYQRLYDTYCSHQLAIKASEELRQAESRTLTAESAAALNRLAGAISHELNSPLGAMSSAVESMKVVTPRLLEARPEERERLSNLVLRLCDTLATSSARMTDIVGRMQRFTNMDRAEVQTVDLKQLLRDVAAMEEANHDSRVKIRLEIGELPAVRCSPQSLSAVFSALVRRAAANAGDNGDVSIRIVSTTPDVTISVEDSGGPVTPAEVTRMFAPEFRVSSGRVITGNWNLFRARRLLELLGGSIRTENRNGGTQYLVTIPSPAQAP